MAQLKRDDILKLARLARLQLSDAEVEKFGAEINEILGYVEMLQKVDTDTDKPTFQVTGLTNVSRADEIINYGYSADELLAQAPAREGRYIKTKRIL